MGSQTPFPAARMLENANANTQGGEFINASRDVIKLVINSGPDVVENLPNSLPTLLSEIKKVQSNPTADGGVGTDVFAGDDDNTTEAPAHPPTKGNEYEKGLIICEICGMGVGFRDEETGGFTLKHWEAHRLTCSLHHAGQSSSIPIIYAPESTAEALAHPPTRRHRTKRTEEERIDYLRADPYVAQFESYRVLCASCDKWIRLRPNSTYCSIPWDAHRKSCLAKKVNNKGVYALDERNALFSKDPDIRKFDADRVLCSICDKWLSVNPDDHLHAVQRWLQHRAACHKTPVLTLPPNPPLLTRQQTAVAIGSGPGPPSFGGVQPSPLHSTRPISPKLPRPINSAQPRNYTSDNLSFHDYNPSNYAPTHESRRRNAEERAKTLRADNLISEVEPNRVLCSLCQKWIQLRQDRSYCAYPWLQHRCKCLARRQQRIQKAVELADLINLKHPVSTEEEVELIPEIDGGGGKDDPESEEGFDSHAEAVWFRRQKTRRVEPSRATMDLPQGNNGRARARAGSQFPPHQNQSRRNLGATSMSWHDSRGGSLSHHQVSQRRVQKAAETAHLRNRKRKHAVSTEEEDELMSEYNSVGGIDSLESEEGLDSAHAEEVWFQRKRARRVEPRHATTDVQRDNKGRTRVRSGSQFPSHQNQSRRNLGATSTSSSPYRHESRGGLLSYYRIINSSALDDEADGGTDVDTYDEDSISSVDANRAQPIRRPLTVSLADLDSHFGRRDFVLASIEYLLRTTYETDDSALSVDPNTRMPQDQHEDSDSHQ